MKRWQVSLLALIALPGLARAQDERNWGSVFRVTPAIGYSPRFTQHGTVEIVTANDVVIHDYDLEFATGFSAGLNLEMRFWNRFSLIAGGRWSGRGDGSITDTGDNVVYSTAGSDFLMAKIGLAVKLREEVPEIQYRQLNGSLFIAPALIRDSGKSNAFVPFGVATTAQHFGVNFGIDAELPLASHISFTTGLEDWLVFWNSEDYLPRVAAYLEQKTPAQTVIAIEAGKSHMLVLHGGLTFKF